MERIQHLYEQTKQALQETNNNNPKKALEILKKVQRQLRMLQMQHPELQKQVQKVEVITLNNLACAYSKKGRHKASFFHLQMVNGMEDKIINSLTPEEKKDPGILHQVATTHSNLCASYSQMGQHQMALREINNAIDILESHDKTKDSNALIVFYYNCAIELEYLGMLAEAHTKALQGLSKLKGDKQMSENFNSCLSRLEVKMQKKQKRAAQYLIRKFKSNTLVLSKNKHDSCQEIPTKNYQSNHLQISPYKNNMKRHSSKNTKRSSQFPRIKMLFSQESTRFNNLTNPNSTLFLQSKKNIASVYDARNPIPKKFHKTLTKRKQTLEKIYDPQHI